MRLIDADALMEQIKLRCIAYYNTAQNAKAETCANVINEINNAPTFDAVPVVRCKDCKHYIERTFLTECMKHDLVVEPNDFCSDGERREDDGGSAQ